MTRSARALLLAAAVGTGGCASQSSESAAPRAPLYNNLGSHHYAITTGTPDAQQYFDQGLTLSYAFNHAEAIRAFKQAIALDPECAMCYWGVAYALGPNINAPITEEAAREAFEAIGQARARAAAATETERALIEALAERYAADARAERAGLDRAYADAMRQVVRRFPDDLEAATLFAQSLMDTSPWNYWDNDGTPHPQTLEVLAALESVLARNADHPGAIHFYIHAVEASGNPARAEQYADRLPALVPGAGHLVHMPGHIYLRTGRYHDASVANENAIKADEEYLAGNPVAGNMMYEAGYYPHNFHFFVASASLEGRRADALRAADAVRAKTHADMLRDPDFGGMMQHMHLTPLLTKMRFGLWDDVLAEPSAPADLPYMRGMSQVARGLAHAAEGRLDEAEAELKGLAAVKDDSSLTGLFVSPVNSGQAVLAIGYEVLAADVAARRKRAAEAAGHFARAVMLEDGLTYTEPPDWPVPVRQIQGAALLRLGRWKEAEAAFRDDMKKFPDNIWSLSGLQQSLERQGRTADAAEAKARLEVAGRLAEADVLAAAAR